MLCNNPFSYLKRTVQEIVSNKTNGFDYYLYEIETYIKKKAREHNDKFVFMSS